MLFNSYTFILFFLFVLMLFNLISDKHRVIFLIFSSYLFYSYWDWRFTILLLSSTILDFYLGRNIYICKDKIKRKWLLTVSIVFNLGVLAFFKYFNFFAESINSMANKFGVELGYVELNIILPVGISFYTFQTMSYTIDIYRNEIKPTNHFSKFALFVSYFPQLVAGPIERAKNIIPQLENGLKTKIINIKPAIVLITTGYFKKVMIGDNCAKFVDHIFGNIEYYNSPELLFALFLFSLQIYADFSGYSNIARGISLLFGIKLMVNFNQPYLSKSIKEFWQRWHISLSTWLRDYLYISLGGNRVKKWKVYRNLLITMLLGGLWHGAGWNFIIWGFLHGIYLTIHKIILFDKSIFFKINSFFNKPIMIIKIITTNILVLITWLFFRVNNINDITLFFQKIIYWQPSEFTPRFIAILLSYSLATLLLDIFEYRSNSHLYILSIKRTAIQWGIICGILFICLVFMFQAKPNPFIYFQF